MEKRRRDFSSLGLPPSFMAASSLASHVRFLSTVTQTFSGARSVRGRFFMFSAAKGAYYRNRKREATDFEEVFLVVSSNVMKFE